MHGARVDACGECMRVHVHGGAWVNCMVWNAHAWESTAGWPGAELHACLQECIFACTLVSAHAWCTRCGWVGSIAEVQGGSAHAHAWSPIECIHAWGDYIIRRSARIMGVSRSSAEWGGRISSSAKIRITWRSAHQTRISE